MNGIFVFIGVALVVVAAVYAIVRCSRCEEVSTLLCVVLVVAAVLMFVISGSFKIIPTGYTGVKTTFGQISETTLQNGFNWKSPIGERIELVNNKQQDITFNDKIWSETQERTTVYYEGVVVTYQINPEQSAWIYANVSNYRDALVSPGVVASAVKSASKQLSDVDSTNRSIIEPLVMEMLQQSLDSKYAKDTVHVNKVIIQNADFDQSYNDAIAAKQKAQVEAEQQSIENQKQIDKAEADAKVKKTRAEGDAEALLISAKAEAEANQLREKSLSDAVLESMWLEKWDGKLPQYVSGENTSTLISYPNGN